MPYPNSKLSAQAAIPVFLVTLANYNLAPQADRPITNPIVTSMVRSGTWESPVPLLAASRTNYAYRSQAISQWPILTNVNVTDNAALAPDGSMSASQIARTLGPNNGIRCVMLTDTSFTALEGLECTYSFFIKNGTYTGSYSLYAFRLSGDNDPYGIATFDLVAKTVSITYHNTDTPLTIEAALEESPTAPGWFKCSVTGVLFAAGAPGYEIFITQASDAEAGAYNYAWGAQLEKGAARTSTINSEDTQVTVPADYAVDSAGNLTFTTPPGGDNGGTIAWSGSYINKSGTTVDATNEAISVTAQSPFPDNQGIGEAAIPVYEVAAPTTNPTPNDQGAGSLAAIPVRVVAAPTLGTSYPNDQGVAGGAIPVRVVSSATGKLPVYPNSQALDKGAIPVWLAD